MSSSMRECRNIGTDSRFAPPWPLHDRRRPWLRRRHQLRHRDRNTAGESRKAHPSRFYRRVGRRGAPARRSLGGALRACRGPGRWHTAIDIGARVFKDYVIGYLGNLPVRAPFDGILRGVVRDGTEVPAGAKLLEVDARGRRANWTGIDGRGKVIAKPSARRSRFTRRWPAKRRCARFISSNERDDAGCTAFRSSYDGAARRTRSHQFRRPSRRNQRAVAARGRCLSTRSITR